MEKASQENANDTNQIPYHLLSDPDHDRIKGEFIAAIDIADVCKLASRHNNGAECEEFQSKKSGSYNVCFFVHFPSDGKRWVVRFPIAPALHDPWLKIQKEIAVMRYLEMKTTIPIATFHAHGQGDGPHDTSPCHLPYIIQDYVKGETLTVSELDKKCDQPGLAAHFYEQLVDIFSQLRMQTFDKAGSLLMDENGDFFLGPASSMNINTFGLSDQHPTTYASPREFAKQQFRLVVDQLELPVKAFSRDDAEYEVFATHEYRKVLLDFVDETSTTFVLTHGDFRLANMIVDENLTIKAIIDWEWAMTVPLQFFNTPLWIFGISYPSRYSKLFDNRWELWQKTLQASELEAGKLLAAQWSPALRFSLRFSIPFALLSRNLISWYGSLIYPEFYKDIPLEESVRRFLDEDDVDGWFKGEVERKLVENVLRLAE